MERLITKKIRNFFHRLTSAIIFVPIIIFPIIISGYFLVAVYLLLLTLIIIELKNMTDAASSKTPYQFYYLVCISSFFFFLFLIVAGNNLIIQCLETIIIIWLFDTFSYIGGNIIKGKKIFPKISKGKTYSGLISGFVITLIISAIYVNMHTNNEYLFVLYTSIIMILAFLGDVIASMLKRGIDIKDTSNLIPGHGGVIDRMDSFIFVFFCIGLYEAFLRTL